MTPIAGEGKWGYYPGRVLGRIMCTLALSRVKIIGNENIDPNKSYIFVANHQSMFDIFLVYGYLNAKFKWIMKQEIRNTPLLGKACESMGHIFVDRSNPMRAQKSLKEAQERLLQGHNSISFSLKALALPQARLAASNVVHSQSHATSTSLSSQYQYQGLTMYCLKADGTSHLAQSQ